MNIPIDVPIYAATVVARRPHPQFTTVLSFDPIPQMEDHTAEYGGTLLSTSGSGPRPAFVVRSFERPAVLSGCNAVVLDRPDRPVLRPEELLLLASEGGVLARLIPASEFFFVAPVDAPTEVVKA